MPDVVLIFDADCPNVPATREHLRQALRDVGLPVRWTEVDRAAPGTSGLWRDHGSPTVLIDGRDAVGETGGQRSCRIYRAGDQLTGAPPVAALVAALRAARGS